MWRRCLVDGCQGEVDSSSWDGIVCERGHAAQEAGGWYVVEDDLIIGLGHPYAAGYLRQPGDPPLEGCRLAAGLHGGDVAKVILTAYTVVAAGDPAYSALRVVIEEGEGPESYVLTRRDDGWTVLLDPGEPVRPVVTLALLRRLWGARRGPLSARGRVS